MVARAELPNLLSGGVYFSGPLVSGDDIVVLFGCRQASSWEILRLYKLRLCSLTMARLDPTVGGPLRDSPIDFPSVGAQPLFQQQAGGMRGRP